MCISAATGLIGGSMEMIAAAQEKQAMIEAIKQQAALQNQYRQQASTAFQPALYTAGPEFAQNTLDQSAKNRMQAYNNVGQAQLGLPGAYAPAPSLRDMAAVQAAGVPRAKLGAYGDWSTLQPIAAQGPQNEINRISSFAHGDAGVFPYQLAAAQHSKDALAALGMFIEGIGGAAGNFQQYNQLYNAPQGGGGGGMVYNPYSFPVDTQYNPYAVPAGGYQDWSNPGGQGLISSGLE